MARQLQIGLVFCILSVSTVSAQSVRYVDDGAPLGRNGQSWAMPYRYLQDALYEASNNSSITEIRVAKGTYWPDRDQDGHIILGDRTATFTLVSGVCVYGGYAGFGATDPDQRDNNPNETILSGDIGTAGDTSDNSYHVVIGSSTDETTVLDGFVITGGNADSSGSILDRSGGGMYNDGASLTVRNCIFCANTCSHFGGAMYNYNYSYLTMINCTFIGNTALFGGGLTNYLSPVTLINSTFSENTATYGGGVYNYNTGTPTLTNCICSRNSATSKGGGLFNESATTILTNCTFIGNTSSTGGGMQKEGGQLRLNNCIVWGNTASSGSQIFGSAIVNYSCIQDGYSGTGNISDDPRLDFTVRPGFGSPCIDAGDNTAVPLDTHDIDNDGDTTEPLPHDAIGMLRFHDDPLTTDTGVGTAPIVDMGACEYGASKPGPSADLDLDGDVDLNDYSLFQQQFTGPML